MAYSYSRCEQFINHVKALVEEHMAGDPHGGHQNDMDPTPQEILNLVWEVGLTYSDFIELDERPGQFDSKYRQNQWHRLLRMVRNDPDNNLFDLLREGS